MQTMTMPYPVSQMDTILDSLEPQSRQPLPSNEPVVPFATSLRLTREQEERMVEHALSRITTMETEMDRHIEDQSTVIDDQIGSLTAATYRALGLVTRHEEWLKKRRRYYNRFYNHMDDRVEAGTIYAESNLTASLSQRICSQMRGRMVDIYFGADPWFAAVPQADADLVLAHEVDQFLKYRHRQNELKKNLVKAVELAFIMGECVVKTVYEAIERPYRRQGEIMVGADGETPVFDSRGDYVFKDAVWIDEMVPVQQDPAQEPVMTPTGRKVLRRDNAVILPPQFSWKAGNWEMTQELRRGAISEPIHYQDFLCPLTAPDIETADIVVHLYDRDVIELANMFLRNRPRAFQTQPQTVASVRAAALALEEMGRGSAEGYASGARARDAQFAEGAAGQADAGGVVEDLSQVETAECYMRYDADGDGIQEEICLMIDRRNRLPIFYDYLQNTTADGRRPFSVVRGLPRHDRWHGVGALEWLEPEQDAIDLFLNRLNLAASAAGSVTFWNPSKTIEGQDNPNLELGRGQTYRLKDGVQDIAKEVLKQVSLFDRDREASQLKMLEMFIQLMQLKSGVVMAAEEAVGEMNATKLATGIRSLERAGNEIFGNWVEEMSNGIQNVLEKASRTEIVRLDRQEVFAFSDGESRQLMSVNPNRVRDVELNFALLLTKSESERMLLAVDKGQMMVDQFYARPLPVQQASAQMTKSGLNALGFKDVDSIIVPIDLAGYGLGAVPGSAEDPMAQAGTGGEQKARTLI